MSLPPPARPFSPPVGRLACLHVLLFLAACDEPPEDVNSIVLSDGAYVQIVNRQDSTSLAALNADVFSLEIWAAGSPLPADSLASPALFLVSNDQGDNEIGVFRPANDSSSIFVFVGESYVGSFPITGCNWNDSDVFTQVVLTYDGTTATVYGNGQLLGSRAVSQDLNIGESDAFIGADWDGPSAGASLGNFWYGAIDEVRLWTIVLPAGEMEFRYENPDKLTLNYSATGLDPLLGLWRFNGADDGVTEPDGSGKGNVGLLNAGGGTLDFSPDGA
ncbi:MAG: LamG domain-containing protein [Candidatus Neomarinimicrobiota bacterium]